MIITGINLKELMAQYDIAPQASYDEFSITLHLDRSVRKYKFDKDYIVTYGERISEDNVVTEQLVDNYILYSGQAFLACSAEEIKIPRGYIGLLQTKGSLARLFVTAHCCDGQIESGFHGHITFEICNMGPLNVRLQPDSAVAQLFIFKTSSDLPSYQGQYNNAKEPTYSNQK